MNRLDRAREFLRRFGLTDPTAAFDGGYYVEPPGDDSGERILTSIELGTNRRYGLVGSIGSGKSTWMLAMCRRARASTRARAQYVDVNKHVALGELAPGALVAAIGRDLGLGAPGEAPGIDDLREFVRDEPGPLVVCFDSLERVDDDTKLRRTLRKDVETLHHLGVVPIVTVPLRWVLLPALREELEAQFDDVLTIEPVDVDQGEGERFLLDVIARRDVGGVVSEESRRALVRFSGGVLRDLLALAQSAVEEMYLRRSDRVTPEHVTSAALRFGEALERGLSSHEVDVLLEVHRSGTFQMRSDVDVGLLVSRRVLRRASGPGRFVVHPALVQRLLAILEAA